MVDGREGGGGAQRPVFFVNEPKNTDACRARAPSAPKLTSKIINDVLTL